MKPNSRGMGCEGKETALLLQGSTRLFVFLKVRLKTAHIGLISMSLHCAVHKIHNMIPLPNLLMLNFPLM